MEFEIITEGAGELFFPQAVPDKFKKYIYAGTESFCGSGDFGMLLFQKLTGEDYEIWISDYLIEKDVSFRSLSADAFLELHTTLNNQMAYSLDGVGKTLMQQTEYNFTYTPSVDNSISFKAGEHYKTFDIHPTMQLLERLAQVFPELSGFIQDVDQERPVNLSRFNFKINAEARLIMSRITKCPFQGDARQLYIDVKVQELCMVLFGNAFEKKILEPVSIISPTDIEKIKEAERIIINQYDEKISLHSLARKVQLNEFKLKKFFKEITGVPVHVYMVQVRLEKAKVLLMEGDQKIADIAIMTGFKSPSTFGHYFRKMFGIQPSAMRAKK